MPSLSIRRSLSLNRYEMYLTYTCARRTGFTTTAFKWELTITRRHDSGFTRHSRSPASSPGCVLIATSMDVFFLFFFPLLQRREYLARHRDRFSSSPHPGISTFFSLASDYHFVLVRRGRFPRFLRGVYSIPQNPRPVIPPPPLVAESGGGGFRRSMKSFRCCTP